MSKYLVCVYGTLLAGFGNHERILEGNSEFKGPATFTGKMYSLGAYPACSTHGNNTIHGEIYEVDEATLARLDRLEGHPTFYCREIVQTSAGPAWVYLINRDEEMSSERVVPSGSWRAETGRSERHAA